MYTLKFKMYFVSRGDVAPSSDMVKKHLIESFLPSVSSIENIEVHEDVTDMFERKDILSSMEATVIFNDKKASIFNKLKLLNKLELLEMYKSDIKNDGEQDYIIIFLGVM